MAGAEAKPGSLSFFTDRQLEVMSGVLDRIVPQEGGLPGAGELGVARYVDRVVGRTPGLKRLFGWGVAQIEMACQARYSRDFADLSEDQRDECLRRVESEAPEFFQALIDHAYSGYYTDPSIIELLGHEARPPQPRGYQLEPGDLTLLENVKRRGQAYREV